MREKEVIYQTRLEDSMNRELEDLVVKIKNMIMKTLLILCVIILIPLHSIAEQTISENGVHLDFATATDEDLALAIDTIKAEQRARLKTAIVFDSEKEIDLAKGKNVKVTAEIKDIPEDLTAGKIVWSSSDNKIATVQQGNIRGVSNGTATISASSTLSDGTEIINELSVKVYTQITALNTQKKNLDVGVDETVEAIINIQPKDASNTVLAYSSSNTSVAQVTGNGLITGKDIGKAVITVASTDGSDKNLQINVTVTKKDDRGVTKTDSQGGKYTIIGYKESENGRFGKAEEGNTFVLVEIEIDNQSSHSMEMYPVLNYTGYCEGELIDERVTFNTLYTVYPSYIRQGLIKSGRKTRGQIAYEVPKDWKELQIHLYPYVTDESMAVEQEHILNDGPELSYDMYETITFVLYHQ